MQAKRRKFDEFRLVKKQPEPVKPKRVPKREVLPRDIFVPTRIVKAVTQKSEKANLPAPEIQTYPKTVYRYSIIPVIAGLLLTTIGLHSIAYLNTAKGASGMVLGAATSAYEDLDAANKSLEERDFGSAKVKFNSAQYNLANAQSALDKFRVLTMVAPPARSADDVLTGAFFLAEAGKNLTTAMQLFDELSVNSAGISTDNFTEKLKQNRDLLKNSLLMISHAEDKFNSAKYLPAEYADTLNKARTQIEVLKAVLNDLVNLEDLFLSFFGSEPRTYLLVFQNYDEMRATGGFIGTYGVLKYENGSIKKLKIESIYNLDGSLTKQIAAPGPFQPEIKKWGMRDSNWFADFPTSAEKLLSFFEMSSETASGVIALTPQIFVDILRMIGPVEMTQYGVTLTPENFQEVVQEQTSVVYDKKLNQPKKFLDDFAPIMLNRMSNLGKEQWFELFQIMKNNFSQKHVLVYSNDKDTQSKIEKLGFDGRVLDTDGDYLSVINSNHGGTKTDLDIAQSIEYSSRISSDGSITNTVKIIRNNTSDQVNRNFIRVMVPQGSILLQASGFADQSQYPSLAEGFESDPDLKDWDKGKLFGNVFVREESGKTEFTGWTVTKSKETTAVILKYILPIKIELSVFNKKQGHSLLLQKQSGSVQTQITGEWILDGFKTVWHSDNAKLENNAVKFSGDGKTDTYWGTIVGK